VVSRLDLPGATRPPFLLFETARTDRENRRSFLFTGPVEIIRCTRIEEVAPALRRIDRISRESWVAGYLAYEAGYAFEPRLRGLFDRSRFRGDLAWFGVFSRPHIFDHEKRAWVGARPDTPFEVRDNDPDGDIPGAGLKPAVTFRTYVRAIRTIKRLIAAGDTYQVNYTFDMAYTAGVAAGELYRLLRGRQPVPYGAYLDTGGFTALSFSPELFLATDGRRIRVRPMKGTAARGRYPEEDRRIAEGLSSDVKNRAENVMIVDLLRNDLGRICRTGSVRVSSLFDVETHRTLHQMTSAVHGRLKGGVEQSDVFRALFPCGSVTGAPKIRTIEIIRELEKGLRGVYCGAIGFMSPDGYSRFSVPIRTLQRFKGRKTWRYRVGSGIVWDSDIRGEWEECATKCRFLVRRVAQWDLLESVLWENGSPLYLDDHRRRMEASAAYFGFRFDRGAFLRLAGDVGRALGPGRHKVRILLGRNGAMRWDGSPVGSAPGRAPSPRLLFSPRPVDEREPLLYHKTTHRPWYDRAMKAVRADRCYDVAFVNTRGALTEGARSNLFARIGGVLYTPPVGCGLLPGVLRGRLLRRGACVERELLPADLQRAEAVYCGNSVRGLARVTPDFSGGKR